MKLISLKGKIMLLEIKKIVALSSLPLFT